MEDLQDLIVIMRTLQTEPTEYMRPVTLVLAGEVRHRIHVRGLRPEGDPIGSYENKYLELRQKKYNRDSTKKMVYSLTRQMEQDFVPVADGNTFGLGFNNSWNFQKAQWLEEMRPGVYALSPYEISIAEDTIIDYLNGLFG